MADETPRCDTCPCWQGRHVDAAALARAAAAGHPRPIGLCHRYPGTVAKNPDEWCGEHPDFRRLS